MQWGLADDPSPPERGREQTTPSRGHERGLPDYENFITHENKRKDLVNTGFSP